MKRYLVVGFLVLVPLYGIRKATEELVQGMTGPSTIRQSTRIDPKILVNDPGNNLIAVDNTVVTDQFNKSVD